MVNGTRSHDLYSSSQKIGQLYPVLTDYHGNIIDGKHRLSARNDWKRMELKHIRTRKDLLIARIISNVVRRVVSPKEKTLMLGQLAEIYNGDVPPGKIAHKIAAETGMSYTWVIKYLPQRFKDPAQSRRNKGSPRHQRRTLIDEVFEAPQRKNVLKMNNFRNTRFITLTIEKQFFNEFERNSLELGIPVEISLLKALEQFNMMMKRAINSVKDEKTTIDENMITT